jgi:hypothetical protein
MSNRRRCPWRWIQSGSATGGVADGSAPSITDGGTAESCSAGSWVSIASYSVRSKRNGECVGRKRVGAGSDRCALFYWKLHRRDGIGDLRPGDRDRPVNPRRSFRRDVYARLVGSFRACALDDFLWL